MNLRRFYVGIDGKPPIIGNGSELYAAPRVKPTHSHHVMIDGEVRAIRYNWEAAFDCLFGRVGKTIVKPIFTEVPHSDN